ncbi:NPC intracellular cholesterol transporter 2 homolog a-like [Zophobas morio]|uniref:NPC intracellular cholesterol transporter 2 homolog a-like n=1 Tax=Zophobas morio TaxID=2755281 RepID=UPI003082E7C7
METTNNSTFVIFLGILVVLNVVNATVVDHCLLGNGTLPDQVELANCLTPPCIFYISGNSTMTMKFRSPRYMENFAPNAVALAMGIKVDYPLDQDDACDGVTNTPCPLAENEYIEYTYSMYILPIFPKISFTLEFALVDKDQDNEQFECFRVEIQLEDLPNGSG